MLRTVAGLRRDAGVGDHECRAAGRRSKVSATASCIAPVSVTSAPRPIAWPPSWRAARPGGLWVEIHQDHAGAAFAQQPSSLEADAAGGADDERDLVLDGIRS